MTEWLLRADSTCQDGLWKSKTLRYAEVIACRDGWKIGA